MHEKEEWFHSHRARYRQRLAVEVERHCRSVFMRLMTQMRCGGTPDLARTEKRMSRVTESRALTRSEQHPRLLSSLPPLLQSLPDAEAAVRAATAPIEAVLLLNAGFHQQLLQAVVDDHRCDLPVAVSCTVGVKPFLFVMHACLESLTR